MGVMDTMSPNLAIQVYSHIHVPVLLQLRILRDCDPDFLSALCTRLVVNLCSEDELIIKCAPNLFCGDNVTDIMDLTMRLVPLLCHNRMLPCGIQRQPKAAAAPHPSWTLPWCGSRTPGPRWSQ